ncbi:MAG: hypothetical protein C4297_11025 [Gemmataceae bacterium]
MAGCVAGGVSRTAGPEQVVFPCRGLGPKSFAPVHVPVNFFQWILLSWAACSCAYPQNVCAGPIKIPFSAEAQQKARSPDKLPELVRAVECFQARRYDEALSFLEQATQKLPELPPARFLLAELFLANNHLGTARMHLERVAREQPSYPGVYLLFGKLAWHEGRWTDAWVHFQKARDLVQQSPSTWSATRRQSFLVQAYSGLAAVAEMRRDWPETSQALRAWLEREPHNTLARERLGRALFFQGQTEAALSELRRAEQLDPALKCAENNMGILWLEKGDLQQATEWMRRAAQARPKDPLVHLELGLCLAYAGDVAGGTRLYRTRYRSRT